ncbi:CO(2)-response secreted protease-like [Amaranthus tricolor]|uniref:CO(2)-response secreted protease-like n=1 Tax=Amaranthus tricolor TaxID=29722 RepID=UPI002582B5C6|nr:CO(2)-response secreted protease-like [Amaranthus tricolor]
MKVLLSILFFNFVSSTLTQATSTDNNANIYIVYMGAKKNNHDFLLNSLLPRNKNALVHNYKNGFSGFAARLTELETHKIAKQPEVVSVFRDPILQLHTTRSWDFLESQPLSNNDPMSSSEGYDTIIGFLDTGIWPESKSFEDKNMGPIPSRWKGKCMEGPDFSASKCNKKLIGARFYNGATSARDMFGHGTHVSSTAAGSSVENASYYGITNGTARGGSPTSRIAMYRVCTSDGSCLGSNILAAFDDAISDNVDVLSLSLGSSMEHDFAYNAIAIGSFHAVQKGITVVCSAGNEGPFPQSLANEAPWILTVGATTVDRDLVSDVILGNNKVVKGESINLSELKDSPIYPLIPGSAAKTKSASEADARQCLASSMDPEKIKGNIVICWDEDETISSLIKKTNIIKDNDGVGIIIISDSYRLVAFNTLNFPTAVVSSKDAIDIILYIKSTKNPSATILATKTIPNFKPAPTVATFSSRGPSYNTKNLLKPDIAAPGVSILAAWIGNDTSNATTPTGRQPPQFKLISGTSMSCPHVSAIAANIKSHNPTWSPAAIKSAIMTTAIQTNNLKEAITTETGLAATPYDFGAGEVRPTQGLQPGLIYDVDTLDYLNFLCYLGYDLSKIKLIAGKLPSGFSCPKNSSPSMVSNINYPSIVVSMNATTKTVEVNRTLTNVGEEAVYTLTIDKPTGVEVTVSPNELKFTAKTKVLEYKVTFTTSSSSVKGDLFGAITWKSNKYKVRSPFVVII